MKASPGLSGTTNTCVLYIAVVSTTLYRVQSTVFCSWDIEAGANTVTGNSATDLNGRQP